MNLAAESARIRFVPGAVDAARLVQAVEKAGFTARVADDRSREEEKARKLAVYRAELVRFRIAAALTLPLVAQMLWMFGGGMENGGAHGSDPLPRWLQLLLATPVQFWIGWRFYDGAWKACAAAAGAVPTWTSSSRWARRWPGRCRPLSRCWGWSMSMSISRLRLPSSRWC